MATGGPTQRMLHVEELPSNTQLTEIKVSPMLKAMFREDSYRADCMAGEPHPMEIEQDAIYQLYTILTLNIDLSVVPESIHGQYSNSEQELIVSEIRGNKKVKWAIDNSFDGLYLRKYVDYQTYCTIFKIACYMKPEHITFWRLQYSGT